MSKNPAPCGLLSIVMLLPLVAALVTPASLMVSPPVWVIWIEPLVEEMTPATVACVESVAGCSIVTTSVGYGKRHMVQLFGLSQLLSSVPTKIVCI